MSAGEIREEAAVNAPPDESARNVAPADLTRVYEDGRIRVSWYAGRCIHSGACLRALPAAFNPQRRPWVDLSGGDADAIAAAVERCPTGALEYERLDGGPQESAEEHPRVVPVRNGPLFARGDIEVKDEQGRVIRRGKRIAFCRCGRSAHLPFCDNTHRAIGFRTNG